MINNTLHNELSVADPAGTKGLYKGREAIRVDLGDKKYVIATKNEGADCESDYGAYYSFYEAEKKYDKSHDRFAYGIWRIPTRSELEEFTLLTNSWTSRNGVGGRLFTIASENTIFFPSSALSGGPTSRRNDNSGYWSSTQDICVGYAYVLSFNENFCEIVPAIAYYANNEPYMRAVRLFCSLPQDLSQPSSGQEPEFLPELTGCHPEGTRGIYKGREAKRFDYNGRRYVIAAKNEGADREEDNGTYYTFDEALNKFSDGKVNCETLGVWRLPTRSELACFMGNAKFTSRKDQAGWLIANSSLFLPATNGWRGCWSSSTYDEECAYCLQGNCYSSYVSEDERSEKYNVRLICCFLLKSDWPEQELKAISLPTLTASHPAGTLGIYRGREAVRMDIGDKKYVIATRNEGARCETDCGDHYTYYEAEWIFYTGIQGHDNPGVWRLPTTSELKCLADRNNTWITKDNVQGCSFFTAPRGILRSLAKRFKSWAANKGILRRLSMNTSEKELFLPAAGYVKEETTYYKGDLGYYWAYSSPWAFQVSYLRILNNDCYLDNKGNPSEGYSVRLFCALPTE